MDDNWLMLFVQNEHADVDEAALVALVLRWMRAAPTFAPVSAVVRKPGRGDLRRVSGAPDAAALAGLTNGGLVMSSRGGSISVLSFARTAKVDRNWASLNPRRVGLQLGVHLKALEDDELVAARAAAPALARDAAAVLGTRDISLEWRSGGQNHVAEGDAALAT